jgi:hypothetical protein
VDELIDVMLNTAANNDVQVDTNVDPELDHYEIEWLDEALRDISL